LFSQMFWIDGFGLENTALWTGIARVPRITEATHAKRRMHSVNDGDQEGTRKLSKKGEHLTSDLQVIQFGIMQEPVETGQRTIDLAPVA